MWLGRFILFFTATGVFTTNYVLSPWNSWTPCSKSCGLGVKSRTRFCYSSTCPKKLPEDVSLCLDKLCEKAGEWNMWSEWSSCSATCGLGQKSRRRVCRDGMGNCAGNSTNIKTCDDRDECRLDSCAKVPSGAFDCNFERPCNGWSISAGSWKVHTPLNNIAPSTDTTFQADCGYVMTLSNTNDFLVSGSISATIDNPIPKACLSFNYSFALNSFDNKINILAIQGQERTVTKLRVNDGLPTKAYEWYHVNTPLSNLQVLDNVTISLSLSPGRFFIDDIILTSRSCTGAVNGGWSEWSDYSECSSICGNSEKTKKRTCTRPPKSLDGAECVGAATISVKCNVPACPVNGGWNPWSLWSDCELVNGVGIAKSKRECSSPYPLGNGRQCLLQKEIDGESRGLVEHRTRTCVKPEFRENGGWSSYTRWSKCSVSCGVGKKFKIRSCTNPVPAFRGDLCTPDNRLLFIENKFEVETKDCYEMSGCPNVIAAWSEWEVLLQCNKTGSVQTMVRYCNNPEPLLGDLPCVPENPSNFHDTSEFYKYFTELKFKPCPETPKIIRHSSGNCLLFALKDTSKVTPACDYYFYQRSDGKFQSTSMFFEDKCIAVDANTPSEGVEIVLRNCENADSVWIVDKTNITHQIIKLASNTSLCLAAPSATPEASDRMLLGLCGSSNDSFTVEDPMFELRYSLTSKCILVSPTENAKYVPGSYCVKFYVEGGMFRSTVDNQCLIPVSSVNGSEAMLGACNDYAIHEITAMDSFKHVATGMCFYPSGGSEKPSTNEKLHYSTTCNSNLQRHLFKKA